MKAGFDAKRLFCNYTGLGNYSRTLVKSLSDYQRHQLEIVLYTPEIRDNMETQAFVSNPYFRAIAPKTPFKSLWRSYGMVKQLKADKIALYHGLSHELPLGLKKAGIRSVVTIHDLIFKVYPGTYQLADRLVYDFKFRYSCRNADRIVAISENTKKDIIAYYDIDPEKIEVIYQACSEIFYLPMENIVAYAILKEYQLPDDYLLCVGSLEERKNQKLLIHAYHNLPPGLRIPLVVVGRGGKYKREVHELVHQYKLEGSVIFIDNLTFNTYLQALYRGATALIYPSLYEGFGLPVVESLLCKTPVITSSVSSLPEAGGPDSLYVDPYNVDALTSALESVLSDETLRNRMAEKGYAYAHHTFGARKLSAAMVECYKKTLS